MSKKHNDHSANCERSLESALIQTDLLHAEIVAALQQCFARGSLEAFYRDMPNRLVVANNRGQSIAADLERAASSAREAAAAWRQIAP